ncbi:MAG: rubrerythrin family protein [Candidatus Altiarchaeales archaeon]|nr:rubrerythrin family protein [Candidatus Altiarchaeota archaeon]MBU4341368.1 rubrerythrin family protein [Candidatus Altiarchaeota archaeon]MBU4406769.1 rubrerythrin family protein [Candidatus Altiarchaeota archaeon]MBU4436839.1 rubrerythrin family protein [Candidatus Altiarchaeota archaeon]MCG2782982.1 rubrerythrin family protein [Candidatus Altiarchaeales archaeon]
MSTESNLKDAFAGESQANRKYLAFSKKAREEGFEQIARLFRAAAESETIHALNHLRILGVGDTKKNLADAVEGETYEFTEMYPGFIEEAKGENNTKAIDSFTWANNVEKAHAGLYKRALERVDEGNDLEAAEYNLCENCGYIAEGEALGGCPVCGFPKNQFRIIE